MRALPATRSPLFSLSLVLSVGCGTLPKLDDDGGSDDSSSSGAVLDTGASDGADSDGTDTESSTDSATSDSGVVPTVREVDIVFVVDNSGSMGEEQAKLAASIGTLVTALDAAEPPVDYRIAVTTTDNGNPWCAPTAQGGRFRATSCRSRSDEFVFEGSIVIDVTEEACFALCTQEELGLAVPWVDVSRSTGTTNVPADEVVGALSCMLPQGISGCGFEQPLESLSKALLRADTPGEGNNGFLRPGALLAVALVTDEVDCSTNPAHDSIFLPEGERVFWSDPTLPAPTSAVCWNAGVECIGSGTYDDCFSVDLDVHGDSAAGDPEQAVLRPLSGYVADLSGRGAYVISIDGVAADGSPVYADSPADPDFQRNFGIGPGCGGPSGSAVPPVRIREVVDAVTGPGHLHSVCAESFAPALTAMADGILLRLPNP